MRRAPKGRETSRSTSPAALSASSSEPPPMSTTAARPVARSKCASALRKPSSASSLPSSTRRWSFAALRTMSANCRAFFASRTALVATASTRVAPSWRASVAMRTTASVARFIAACESSPRSSIPAPRRGADFISSTTLMWPSADTSATIARIEFDPMSIAATRSSEVEGSGRGGDSAVLQSMFDRLALRQVYRILGDVGREIGDTLEVAAHEKQLERGRDGGRILEHVREEDAEERVVQRVHLIVAPAHVTTEHAVAANEGVERVAEHVAGAASHILDFRIGGDVGAHRHEALGGLRDVHRVIAHALEIARDLDRADDEAQVARHRLLEREERDGEPFDLDLEGIDLAVALDDGVGLAGVAMQQCLHGHVDQRLGALGHVEQPLLQLIELLVEVPKTSGVGGAHPNLPVT